MIQNAARFTLLQPALGTTTAPAIDPIPAFLRHNVPVAARRTHVPGRRTEETGVAVRDAADEALRALMSGYQAGDRDAFERLYVELAPVLGRLLLRLTRDPGRVDDLLQETFLQVHRARHTYDPAFPVRPWAYAIARHVFLMDCRYRQRRGDLAACQPLDETMRDKAPSHEEMLATRSELGHALSRLSRGTRESVVMHHLHGLSFREIARRLHTGGPALRARASRGMARMRDTLEDEGNGNEQKP